MKVLLIDDDTSVLTALARMIRLWGGEADCADNAQDGAVWVESRNYDFVLLDLSMPGKNGIWFLENARVPPATRVLLMSGFVTQQIMRKVLRLGACGCLEKPFGPDELMRALEQHAVRPVAA
jgi:DNA-binding response OmpR family regulator